MDYQITWGLLMTEETKDLEVILEDSEVEHIPVVHNPVVEVVPSKPMTVLESDIAEYYSMGDSSTLIASKLGITASTVRNTLAKPHIRDFVSELVSASYLAKKEGRLRIINKIIDAKIEKIEEAGGDFSTATKKDVVDLLQISDVMLKEQEKKDLGVSDNVYLNIINQVTG